MQVADPKLPYPLRFQGSAKYRLAQRQEKTSKVLCLKNLTVKPVLGEGAL
jgi:hypothetical protein